MGAFLCKSYLYKAIEKDEKKDEMKYCCCKRTKKIVKGQ